MLGVSVDQSRLFEATNRTNNKRNENITDFVSFGRKKKIVLILSAHIIKLAWFTSIKQDIRVFCMRTLTKFKFRKQSTKYRLEGRFKSIRCPKRKYIEQGYGNSLQCI